MSTTETTDPTIPKAPALRTGDPIGIGADEWARTEDEVRRVVEWASENRIRPSSIMTAALCDALNGMSADAVALRLTLLLLPALDGHQILQIVCDAANTGIARRKP